MVGALGGVGSSMLLSNPLPRYDHRRHNSSLFLYRGSRHSTRKASGSPVVMMRLFGPAIFEASKLKVLFVGGVNKKKHPGNGHDHDHLPRTYTLTHSDITSRLTLAISQTINNSQLQGWYNRLQRDEVVAEWKKVKGKMSLHVHCHISGGHFLLDLFARLRYYIFCKELPVVLMAFVHGDEGLFNNYPELEEAMVWVYFHSNISEFNKVECWGPLKEAVKKKNNQYQYSSNTSVDSGDHYVNDVVIPGLTSTHPEEPCKEACKCCFPPMSMIPWAQDNYTA